MYTVLKYAESKGKKSRVHELVLNEIVTLRISDRKIMVSVV